jgi:hypothetical protein
LPQLPLIEMLFMDLYITKWDTLGCKDCTNCQNLWL